MKISQRTLDVQAFIDENRFSRFQWVILSLCFLVAAADGFDTAAVGFVAPALIEQWGVARASLGPVMSAALLGLGIGALATGPLADRIGRKMSLVLSVFFFGMWSLISAHAGSIGALGMMRFFTGLGLGATMPNAVTLMAEYAPARIRAFVVNTAVSGFSAGLACGAMMSAWLIPHFGWRAVFMAGGAIPLGLSVLLMALMPESLQFAVHRQHADEKIRRILTRLAPMNRFEDCRFIVRTAPFLQATGTSNGASSLALVLSSRFRFGTFMLWLAYFMGLLIYYLFANWMPTLFRDSGFLAQQAALLTALFPLGGILGNLCVAWVMDRFTGHRVVALTYLLIGVLLLLVGLATGYPLLLGTLIFLAGTVVTSSAASLMPLAASFYPTAARATGVAWMIGVGRLGGVAGALAGGVLLGLGWQPGAVFSLLAAPAVMGATGLFLMRTSAPTTVPYDAMTAVAKQTIGPE
jgi:MFS transporter, AAHS family, 4-hydroxybenzoate transporter